MSLPRIVGITGYAQHGKDTVASVFVEHGYQRVALADKLKEAVLVLDPWIPGVSVYQGRMLIGDEDELGCRLSYLVEQVGWDEAKRPAEVRRLLQVFGTEVGRNLFGEDVWIEALARSVKGFYSDQGPRVVISDVRFLNEARFIRRCRGEVYRVHRPDFDNGVGVTHASEREIASILTDETFVNDLDEKYLRGQVARYIEARNRSYENDTALD